MDYSPYYEPSQSRFDWTILIYVLFFGGYLLLRWWRKHEAAKIVVDAPILLSLYLGGNKLTKMSDGMLGKYHYNLMVTQPIQIDSSQNSHHYPDDDGLVDIAMNAATLGKKVSNAGKIIITLQLPVKSSVHIVGLGVPDTKTSAFFDKRLASCNLEPASLEGDFPNYFSLYCSHDDQMELRQVLNPATMAFLVDFCKHEDWELFQDTLYFAQNNVSKKHSRNDDSTGAVEDAQLFVKRALPVLQRMHKFADPSKASVTSLPT
ncbi:MAG TPA: hypothetical protein VJC09_01085 [Candidatus Saccharimonadales bacterium]|nr:hypothetical protein [Candidatus Saccharimonadales bacterium]